MSQHEYCNMGYGIDISNDIICATTSNGVKNLLRLCPNVKEVYFKDFDMDTDITLNYLNELDGFFDNTCQAGLHALISECMNELMGVWNDQLFGPAVRDDDSEAFVLFFPIYPWHFNIHSINHIKKDAIDLKFDHIVSILTEGKIVSVDKDYFAFVNYC